MKVLNCTPHQIDIVDPKTADFNPTMRKYTSENPTILMTIPASGIRLGVTYDIRTNMPIDGIPVKNKHLIGLDPVPDVDVAIVSGLYASATTDPRVYSVIDPVFTPDGKKVVGCLAIGKVVK